MTVSRVSRKTTRNTGTAKTWTVIVMVLVSLCFKQRFEDAKMIDGERLMGKAVA